MIHLLKRLLWKTLKMLPSSRISIAGRQVLTPRGYGFDFSVQESWMSEVLAGLLGLRPGTLLDVGVNIGQTLAAYKTLSPQGAYIGLEPNPDCVVRAKALVAANGYENVQIIPGALADVSGVHTLRFFNDVSSDSSASMIAGFRDEAAVVSTAHIVAITGEQLASSVDLSALSILKVDVEGAEAVVLAALEDQVRKARPFITVEILPVYGDTNSVRYHDQCKIETMMADWGYGIYRIQISADTNAQVRGALIGVEKQDSFGIHSDLTLTEYVLVPDEDAAAFEAAFA